MANNGDSGVQEPFDLIRLSLSERIFVKLRGDRELTGVLHAYDSHGNLVMSDVTESIYTLEVDEATGQERSKVTKRQFEVLYTRGDSVVLISPPARV